MSMSIRVNIPHEKRNDLMLLTYKLWCSRCLYKSGEAVTWKMYGDMVIFLHEEDAVAFKLRFGL